MLTVFTAVFILFSNTVLCQNQISKQINIFLIIILISSLVDPVQYNIFYAVSFDGSNLTNTSSGCIVIGSGGRLRCLNTNGKLVDGDIGPMNSISDNLGEFFVLVDTQ